MTTPPIQAAFLAASLGVAAACGGSTSTTPADPAAVVFDMFEAVAANDLDTLEALVPEDYRQHSSLAADGREGLFGILDVLRSAEITVHRTLVDGELVALHSTYGLADGTQLVAFDVFRVQEGQVVEHWDALQPLVSATESASGRSMTDGPTEVRDLELTEANRALVTEYVAAILTRGEMDRVTEFVSTDTYQQHNPLVGDGLDGLGAFVESLAEQDLTFYYTASPIVVAQGDFVLVGSEGVFGPAANPPYAVFYDLFRVEDGLIVEHWDVIPPDAATLDLPHENGWF